MKRINKRLLIVIIIICLIIFTVITSLFYFGIIHFNSPSYEEYPVRGVDASVYQGDINWSALKQQDIKFAFIKATEGSDFVDKNFKHNWEEAHNVGLYVGAYHFFSFESSGKTQAENFINVVGELKQNSLPPVIDIEYYNVNDKKSVSNEKICKEIKVMSNVLEEYYGKKPILYVTYKTYKDFIGEGLNDNMIWVRSVYCKPFFVDSNEWTFWKYSNRHRLYGYSGEERYIDMNVFNGTLYEFYDLFEVK